MYEMTAAEWPYAFVRRDEFDTFAADMVTYYIQLARHAERLPKVDDFAESPFPFFLSMMVDRGEFDGHVIVEDLTFQALKDTELYDAFRRDVRDHYASHRFARIGASAKGGGFSCLGY